MHDTDSDNVQRLLAAGITPDDVVEISRECVRAYDRNRRLKGTKNGAIGMIGRDVYQAFSETPDYNSDINAFLEYRPYTRKSTAERLGFSMGAVGLGVDRLIEHGFIIKRREGWQFKVRLAVPAIALTELGELWSIEIAGPNTKIGLSMPSMGKKLLTLYPPPIA